MTDVLFLSKMENTWVILVFYRITLYFRYNRITKIFIKITEGDFMKKWNWFNVKANMWKAVASLALVVTTLSVNTTCMFEYYQPKMPKGSEQLKHR